MAEKFNVLDVLTEVNRTYKPQQAVPEGFFSDLAAGASDAFLSGAADLPRVLQKVTDSLALP